MFKDADGVFQLTLTKSMGAKPTASQLANLCGIVRTKLSVNTNDEVKERNAQAKSGDYCIGIRAHR